MLKKIREMKDEDGFTLIELMVVVLIIAILIAIALPTFLGLRERAQNRAAQSNLRNGLASAKAYFTDGETYVGFTAAQGDTIEPSLEWVDGTAPTAGQVGVVTAQVDANTVQLVALSASGDWFCIEDDAGVTGYGGAGANAAAVTAANCGAGAWT